MIRCMTWLWTLLRAGSFRLDGGSMFGVVPKPVWTRMVEPDAHNRIPLQTNCLLLESTHALRTEERPMRILIETGYGDKWTNKDRDLFAMERRTIVDALREESIEPEHIDLVIATHLHFDHAGGLTHLDENGEPAPAFPNAQVIIQKTEWDDALANKSTMTKTYLRNHLDPIADCLRLIDGEDEIAPGVIAWPMPGHTWGQQAVRFEDDAGMVCFPGDVMPTANHVGLAFNMGYDMLPYQNLLSKKELLARGRAERWRIVLDHEPGHPVVRVVEDSNRSGRYALEQVD